MSKLANGPQNWLSESLTRRLLLGLVVALGVSLAFLAWVGSVVQHRSMRGEHERAAQRVTQLFEVSLRNAMMNRNLDEMSQVLHALGRAPGVRQAVLLNPQGEARFASAPEALDKVGPSAVAGLCLQAGCAVPRTLLSWQDMGAAAGDQLRVTYPIANEARCGSCHVPVSDKPVNGVLVVDFLPINDDATGSYGWLALAGAGALVLFASIMAITLRRQVTRPLARLNAATDRMTAGDWSARADMPGNDELARLGQRFDHMAAQIATTVGHLAEQKGFLQGLIDAMPDPVLVMGQDHRIRLANSAYGRMVGQPADQLVGSPCFQSGMGRSEPCPSTLLHCPVAEVAKGAASGRTVMSLRQSDGGDAPVEIEYAPLRMGSELLTVEVMRPMERSLRYSQEQRLSTIGLLANGVAHEIHNPLASIRLALQASLRGMRANDIERDELIEYLELVDQQIDRCVGITQRLMQMSQMPGSAAMPVDLRAACDDVLSLLAIECKQMGVQVVIDLEPERPMVLSDEAELRQVFVNLIQNALHAMPQGGAIRIVGRAQEGEHAYRLDVGDSGCGIAADNLSLIFMPFFSQRVDGKHGMGLGLPICKSIVERSGGRITVSSEVGKGTVFHLHLRVPGTDDAPSTWENA